MKLISLLVTIPLVIGSIYAQTIEIQPYLQDITPNSAVIMWQTDGGEQSLVEYGLTPDLGQQSNGSATNINYDEVRLHRVKIDNLERFTTYYYKVRTGSTQSEIFQFKTTPFATDHQSFRLVAMSDMQIDGNRPWQFREVANDGVVDFIKENYGNEISDELALILIPGDLVTTGTVFHQWKDHFFNPAEKLFSQVPLYPVPGNHERNSQYFFEYFELPQNGTPAYGEHWWYKDYGNLRILGFDSNDGFRDLPDQINWLESILKETTEDDDIDFVFAQMHHPHKSELWIPGEEKFTGEVVKRLEAFTTNTGKPSIHFFGHTHGYSRGQSRDHNHLWVNVATAGGAIDNWGEFEGRDYAEFTVTEDDYGFVLVEVDASPVNPKFTLKRISRGDQDLTIDNKIIDSITIYKKELLPERPAPISPLGADHALKDLVLRASPFQGLREGAFHAASHWQLSKSADFVKPDWDSWKQHENWYYNENRQAGDDLTDDKVYRLLKSDTKYFWRVRYRDQYLNWSAWSETATFSTK